MKSDLDRLMAERGYAAVLVMGGAAHNAPMYYLANGAKVTETAILVKKRGHDPVLIVSGMERDEAAKSGLPVINVAKYDYQEMAQEANGDRLLASARLYGKIFAELGVKGKVVACGQQDQGAAYQLITAINEVNPQVEVVGEFSDTLLNRAMATKDADEVKRMRAVGKKTMRVVAGTEDFLVSHKARRGYLVKKDGARLTVGDVKRRIRELLMEEGVVDVEDGVIFAVGADAGVPHSRGDDRDPIALGKTIVYDIFPAEPGGGYYFDFTRTWCLGYAPPEAEAAYDHVLGAFRTVMRALKPGEACRTYQKLVCDYFEARGHPTVQSNPRTTEGYVHGLAHGVGLNIHEPPFFSLLEGNTDRVEPGVVFTVEPGLYYPEKGFGVRVEDLVWLNPQTLKFETLAHYHKDLVLKVKGIKGQGPRR